MKKLLTAREGADGVVPKRLGLGFESSLFVLGKHHLTPHGGGAKRVTGRVNQCVQQVRQTSGLMEGTFWKVMGQHKLWAFV